MRVTNVATQTDDEVPAATYAATASPAATYAATPASLPVTEYVVPAPSVTHAAPDPVFEYVTPATVIENIAPAPAVMRPANSYLLSTPRQLLLLTSTLTLSVW